MAQNKGRGREASLKPQTKFVEVHVLPKIRYHLFKVVEDALFVRELSSDGANPR